MRTFAAAIILAAGAARAAGAQWHVGLEIGAAEYRGASRDTTGSVSGAYLRPDGATSYALRIGREFGTVRVSVRAAVSLPGIAGVAGDVTVSDRTTGNLLEIAPFVALRVARVGPGGAVRVEAGPALGLWNIDGEIHKRIAAAGALAYEWPIAGRLDGAVRVEGTVGPSVFEADQLPPDLERRPTWRYGVTLGLRYRL